MHYTYGSYFFCIYPPLLNLLTLFKSTHIVHILYKYIYDVQTDTSKQVNTVGIYIMQVSKYCTDTKMYMLLGNLAVLSFTFQYYFFASAGFIVKNILFVSSGLSGIQNFMSKYVTYMQYIRVHISNIAQYNFS